MGVLLCKFKYGYWGVRARGHVGRLLIQYVGIQWEQVKYTDPNQWFAVDKQKLGLDFPNLPYLIDEGLNITETSAIQKHILVRGQRKDLLGRQLMDKARVSQLMGVLTDFREILLNLCFDKDWQTKKSGVWQKLKPKVESLQKYIGQKKWSMGYITLADFYIAQYSNYFEKIYPDEYRNYPAFERIKNNFNNLPQIKAYYAKQTSVKGPFLPPSAAVKM